MADTHKKPRGFALLAIAAVAGIVAGTVAVYVRGSGNSNVTAACAGAAATAADLAPFARGEVAAFQVADPPQSFANLAFNAPDGTPTTLGAAFPGRTVLVNLWATWCVPCREEMPALDRLEASTGSDAFTVAAINVDVRNEERAQEFLEEIGVANLDFYADPTLATFNELKGRGIAFGLPTTVLVDGKGCGLGVMSGPAVWDSEDAKALVGAAIAAAG